MICFGLDIRFSKVFDQKLENKLFEYKNVKFERFVFESKYIILVFWNASENVLSWIRVTNKIRRYLSYSLKCKPRPENPRSIMSSRPFSAVTTPVRVFYFFRLFNEFVLFFSNSNPGSPEERKICSILVTVDVSA